MRPFLSATHDRKYAGQGVSGELPYQGVIVGHTNLPEWEKFCALPESKAFRDRMCEIMVPYCVRLTEEREILKRYLSEAGYAKAPVAPYTLDMLAEFAVRGRLIEDDRVTVEEKMRAYDGQSLPPDDSPVGGSKKKGIVTVDDMRAHVKHRDGELGASVRFNQAVLSHAIGLDTKEGGLDSVLLLEALEYDISRMMSGEKEEGESGEWTELKHILDEEIKRNHRDHIETVIRNARIEKRESLVEAKMHRYAVLVDARTDELPVLNTLHERTLTREEIDQELMLVEKGMGIIDRIEFRKTIQKILLRSRLHGDDVSSFASELGQKPDLLEKFTRFFVDQERAEEEKATNETSKTKENRADVTDFVPRDDARSRKAHEDFMGRIQALGYTALQAERLVKYYNELQATRK